MKLMTWFSAGCLVCSLLIGGCVHQQSTERQTSYEQWQVKAKSARGYSPSPKRRTVSVGPEGVVDGMADATTDVTPEPARPLPTDLISINMTDIDVSVLLRALAKAANQNIIINEKVTGRANISIEKAPWDQAFNGILNTHGLTYRWEGDILRIMTLEDLEAALKREEQKQDLRSVGPLSTRVLRIDYAEAGKLKDNLETFLSKNRAGNRIGSVMVDEHTNSLIVQALPEDIQEMLPLVAELDRPTPQILIEAHIVEASKGTAMDLGIQWGGQYKNTLDSGNNFTVGSGRAQTDANTINIPSGGFASNFPANIGQGAGMTIGFLVESLDGNVQLAAQLSALQNEGRLNILSNPSITTLDNQIAVFASGREVPYQSVDGNGTPKTEFKKAELLLEVTPHVINGEALKLKINTKKDEVDTSDVFTIPPIITKRAETTVILYDGQTTVIGGLNKETDANSEAGVPVLKDIPVMGWLFKGTSSDREFEDVMIFITPHILKQHIGGDLGTAVN
jgi:type IV pilus assembly protein PilQ